MTEQARFVDALRELLGKRPLYARWQAGDVPSDPQPLPPVHWARGYWTRDGLGQREKAAARAEEASARARAYAD